MTAKKQTNVKVFLDSNILIYCYSQTEPEKRQKAQSVSELPKTIISTQVLKEFSNILRKKFILDWITIRAALEETETNHAVFINTPGTIRRACSIAEPYGFSFYDSLIVTAALENKCKTLYSEDLQHNQTIEKTLTIINPFI